MIKNQRIELDSRQFALLSIGLIHIQPNNGKNREENCKPQHFLNDKQNTSQSEKEIGWRKQLASHSQHSTHAQTQLQ